jgi:hypothetical protein|tara:strand:- start:314 stop:493 length:180 start_codon:yes stop_codon:yes gene_type:complete
MTYIWFANITLTTSKANDSHLSPITLAESKVLLGYTNCRGGTPPNFWEYQDFLSVELYL